ncbi:MAG: thioredoxin, partial [Christensenellales bacterium]
MALMTFDEKSFEATVLNGTGPALVDFWAAWCGPCRMLGPVIDELAAEAPEGAVVGKVNVDENPSLAAKYGVMTIPTVILFRDGIEAERMVGVQPKSKLA